MTLHPVPPRSWLRLAIFALPWVAFLLRLGGAPLFDDDEGAFSEATREMFERGDFLSTYLNGENRFDKPILIYWLQALGYLLFGPAEWAFRLPSALAAIGWCYAIWHFARPRLGADTALVALAVAASALGPFVIGRAATADALLNLLLALALFDAWRHIESGQRAPLLRSYMWIGLGILTKGPIALMVPAAVSLLYYASRREWRPYLKLSFDPLGWLILAILVVPWYAAALAIHGQDFIDGFILKHNVRRFTGTLEKHAGSIFYYAFVTPLLLLPWTGPLLASLRRIKADVQMTDNHERRHGLRRYLWLWAAFVIVFFSLSGTKLPHYALYGATPLFLLIAVHRHDLRRSWLHLLAPTLLFVLFLLLPTVFGALSTGEMVNHPYYRAQLADAPLLADTTYYAVCIGAFALWLVALVLMRGDAPWRRLLVAAGLLVLVQSLVVAPWLGAVLQGSLSEAVAFVRTRAEPVVLWRLYAPSVSVYREAVTLQRPPQPGEIAITRFDRVPDQGYQTLFHRGGVAVVRPLPEEK
ncbi:glycosyl hydrolase [Betaproteobacteria bacterium]|nr:glycosyl hydrolase [Betaproteobacteria bacterium]GHT98482.1 glycosyl hydrolase [Betaproteobacteria bacterium]GHU16847.1 glycosyl hydrolase [Betaproteobacteria bacterium]